MGKKAGGRVRVKQIGGPKGGMPSNPLADLTIPPDEMIHLPPKPDSNSGFLIWPMGETFTMTYKNFCTIYPNYLDSEKSVKLGRRISAKDAVPEPTIQDIHEALASLDIRHVIQPHKGYSRDGPSRWDNPGRVLVDLEGAISTGVLEMSINGGYDMDDAIPEMGADDENDDHDQTIEGRKGRGKKQLLRQLAQVMSGLPNRQNRLNEKRKLLEEEQLKAAKTEKDVTSTGGETGGASGNRKKKGKKKK